MRNEKCEVCGTPLIPDLDSVIFSGDKKGQWDEHTYKFNCRCMPSDFRVAIG